MPRPILLGLLGIVSSLSVFSVLSSCSSTNLSKTGPSPPPWAKPLPLTERIQSRDDATLPSGPLAVSLNDSLAFSEGSTLSLRPATNGSYYGSERRADENVVLTSPSGELRGLAFEGSSSNLFIATADRVFVIPQRSGNIAGQMRTAGSLAELAGGGAGLEDVPGRDANLSGIQSLALTPEGHVLIASECRALLLATRDDAYFGRKISAGRVYTLAGNGCGTATAQALARETPLGNLRELVSDRRGNLIFSDQNGLWIVPQLTGQYFGQTVQAGRLYALPAPTALQTTEPAPATRLAVSSEGHVVIAHSSGLYLLASQKGRFLNLSIEAGALYPLVLSAPASWAPSSEARLVFNSADRLFIRRGNRIFVSEPLPDFEIPGATPTPSPSPP